MLGLVTIVIIVTTHVNNNWREINLCVKFYSKHLLNYSLFKCSVFQKSNLQLNAAEPCVSSPRTHKDCTEIFEKDP